MIVILFNLATLLTSNMSALFQVMSNSKTNVAEPATNTNNTLTHSIRPRPRGNNLCICFQHMRAESAQYPFFLKTNRPLKVTKRARLHTTPNTPDRRSPLEMAMPRHWPKIIV